MCELLALPANLGSLSLSTLLPSLHIPASMLIGAPLVEQVIGQDHQLGNYLITQQQIEATACFTKHSKQREHDNNRHSQFSSPLQCCVELTQEKGASTWLSALPIDEYGFSLHKSAFRYALPLHYNWPLVSTYTI